MGVAVETEVSLLLTSATNVGMLALLSRGASDDQKTASHGIASFR